MSFFGKHEFVRHFVMLFSGSVLAQIILFSITPLLTRIYTEEQFGILFVYSSIVMVLSIVVSLQYELAIVLPKNDNEAAAIFWGGIIITLVNSFILVVLTIFFTPFFNALLYNKGIGNLMYFVPISVCFVSIFQLLSYWDNRYKLYKFISQGRIYKAVSTSLFQIAGEWHLLHSIALTGGLIGGHLASAIFMLCKNWNTLNCYINNVTLTQIRHLAFKYRKIPLFNTPIKFFNTLSNHIPILLLGNFYGLQEVAYFGLAHKIIAVPMGLISEAVGQVLYRKSAEMVQTNQKLSKLIKKTYRNLFLLGSIPFILLAIFAPFIFSWIFGTEWEFSGQLTRLLIPWLFLGFMNSPITFIITVLNRQHQMFVYELLLLVCRVVALYIGFVCFGKVFYSILFYSAVGVVFNIFMLGYLLYISNRQVYQK